MKTELEKLKIIYGNKMKFKTIAMKGDVALDRAYFDTEEEAIAYTKVAKVKLEKSLTDLSPEDYNIFPITELHYEHEVKALKEKNAS